MSEFEKCAFCHCEDIRYSITMEKEFDIASVGCVKCGRCVSLHVKKDAVPELTRKICTDHWNSFMWEVSRYYGLWTSTECSPCDCRTCIFCDDTDLRTCTKTGFCRTDPRNGCCEWRKRE